MEEIRLPQKMYKMRREKCQSPEEVQHLQVTGVERVSKEDQEGALAKEGRGQRKGCSRITVITMVRTIRTWLANVYCE